MFDGIAFTVAFITGFSSFFTPSILTLIPVYITFISGVSMMELRKYEDAINKIENIKIVCGNLALFILGFSVIFVVLGITAGAARGIILRHISFLKTVGGAVIILFGINVFRFLKSGGSLEDIKTMPIYVVSSLILGMLIGLTWTPSACPILAVILPMTAKVETLPKGVVLLSSYSFGLSLPRFASGFIFNRLLNFFHKAEKYVRMISFATALLLIIIGLLFIF